MMLSYDVIVYDKYITIFITYSFLFVGRVTHAQQPRYDVITSLVYVTLIWLKATFEYQKIN